MEGVIRHLCWRVWNICKRAMHSCQLIQKAIRIRELIIEMLLEAGSGHSAGPLGLADIFASFYFHVLNHDPKNPAWEDRDRLVLSNGHCCPVRYAAMALSGYFAEKEL